jgi:type IV pilus assembly protein PilB
MMVKTESEEIKQQAYLHHQTKTNLLKKKFNFSENFESSFERAFWTIINKAIESNSSDIAMIPWEKNLEIRIRVYGIWRHVMKIEKDKMLRFMQISKEICNFNMSLKDVSQDARFTTPKNFDYNYDFRANIMPTCFGERIVLRLLEGDKNFSFKNYLMSETQKEILLNVINKWQGMILCSGRTGSGKTTLLYSLLSEINREEKTIFTLEQPVEYRLGGVSQTDINEKISWANGLRSLMRQSPDVILLGEIRDQETAETALHAAASGHLLFSTTHANSARESINKISLFGIKKELLKSNLLFAGAQKLAPRSCQSCLVEDLERAPLVEKIFGEKFLPKISLGCEECDGTGIKGRVLIFESIAKDFSAGSGKKSLKKVGSMTTEILHFLKNGEINALDAAGLLDS